MRGWWNPGGACGVRLVDWRALTRSAESECVTIEPFLVAYDYGMGGLWGIVLANTADEILGRYPELVIVDSRPGWMTDERFDALDRYAIDDEPAGLLLAVLRARNK